MAKKSNKKKDKNNTAEMPNTGMGPNGAVPPTAAGGAATTAAGVPPVGSTVYSGGMFAGGIPPTGAVPPPTGAVPPLPQTAPNTGKGKKKDKKKGKKQDLKDNIDLASLSPEQLAQLQLEEAIKESTDPASKLRKLKSPLSFGSCLITLLIFIVLTVLIVFLICWIMVDKFNPITLAKDMLDQFGITGFFRNIGNWFKNLFGGGNKEAVTALLSLLR